MRPLIARLRLKYGFIILNSAPVLAAAETAILSGIVEKTVFVIRWGSTPPQVARHAMTQLLKSGGAQAAVLLSMADIRHAARYGDMVAGAYQRLEGYYLGHPDDRVAPANRSADPTVPRLPSREATSLLSAQSAAARVLNSRRSGDVI